MSKKALVIVGLAAVIAATSGIAFASNRDGLQKTKTFSDAETVSVSDDGDVLSDDGGSSIGENSGDAADPDGTVDPEGTAVSRDPSEDLDDDNSDSGQASRAEVIASYTVQRVILRDSGEEQSMGLVFGKYASLCYLKLYDDGTAELCVNPSAGTSRRGEFTVKDDRMYVDYGGVEPAEYPVLYADGGGIETIIVPYGEYDVYFG